jgi:hypothetical protein
MRHDERRAVDAIIGVPEREARARVAADDEHAAMRCVVMGPAERQHAVRIVRASLGALVEVVEVDDGVAAAGHGAAVMMPGRDVPLDPRRDRPRRAGGLAVDGHDLRVARGRGDWLLLRSAPGRAD